VDEYFASLKSGLSIVGYYHANECFDDYELSSIARKVGDHIARYCPQAGILLLDNRQLGALSKGGTKKPVVQVSLDLAFPPMQVLFTALHNEILVIFLTL
jgi:hypothetical protein